MAIRIDDAAGLLGVRDQAALMVEAGRWPFDVHVVISTAHVDPFALEARVSAAVDGPNVVAIGLDPAHRTTFVHFGKETGVPASQWPAIYSAGNGDFNGARWAEGLVRIADRATSAKEQGKTVTLQSYRPAAPSSCITGAWAIGGILLVATLLGVYGWWRANKWEEPSRRRRRSDDAVGPAYGSEAASWDSSSWDSGSSSGGSGFDGGGGFDAGGGGSSW